jgi:hypothetical protein
MPRKFEDAFDHEARSPIIWPWVLVVATIGTGLWLLLA